MLLLLTIERGSRVLIEWGGTWPSENGLARVLPFFRHLEPGNVGLEREMQGFQIRPAATSFPFFLAARSC